MSDLKQIGKFEIHERIGVGGFGEVFKGYDPFIKRFVAVKTCTALDEEVRGRFFHEAEIAGNLHHRNVTTVYDFGVHDDLPYLVQEYLGGEDLDRKVKRRQPLPLSLKISYLRQIAQGLAYAHAQGVVHRDVKPANIRILDDDTIKIMDFGIAKLLQQETGLTKTGMTVGTAAYLAPEQIRGDSADQRTDVFSFGVLAYELLSFKRPFEGEQISAVLYQILHSEPVPIEHVWPDCPASLRSLLEACLRKEPGARPADCSQIVAWLDEAIRADGLTALQPVSQAGPEDPTTLVPVFPATETTNATDNTTDQRDVGAAVASQPAITRTSVGDLELAGAARGTATLPLSVGPSRRGRTSARPRRSKTPMVVAAVTLLLALAGAAWWFAQRPASAPSSSSSGVQQAALPVVEPPDNVPNTTGEPSQYGGPGAEATPGVDALAPAEARSPEDGAPDAPGPSSPSAALEDDETDAPLVETLEPAVLTLVPGWEPATEFRVGDGPYQKLDTQRALTLAPGRHQVRFRINLARYATSQRRQVELAPGQRLRLAPPFPRPAGLEIRPDISQPNGQAWLNGEKEGRTPLRFSRMAPGAYVLEVRPLAGHDVPAILQTIDLAAGETTIVTFRLGSDTPFVVARRPNG